MDLGLKEDANLVLYHVEPIKEILDPLHINSWCLQWQIQDFPDGGRQPLIFKQKPIIWQ